MSEYLLELEDVSKSFPGVKALDGVGLRVKAGEAHSLVGENGAGKSTLLKILSGVYQADGGTVRIDGKETAIHTPKAAQAAGIAMIHQELQQIPELDVTQNLFLGSPRVRFGVFKDADSMRRRAAEVLAKLDPGINVRARLRDLSVARRQLVEIGRALHQEARIIAMDEPTSSLTPQEFDRLAEIIGDLRGRGVAIIYVSHKLDEIRRVCQRATVLRDGKLIGAVDLADVTDERLLQMMVGRPLQAHPHINHSRPEIALRVQGVSWGKMVRNVSFELRRGEVLGVAGLVGAGRTELMRVIAGLEKPSSGTMEVGGEAVQFTSRRHAIRKGIGLVPEERKREGIVPQRPVYVNVGLPRLGKHARGGLIQFDPLRREVKTLTEQVHLRPPDIRREIRLFSGGNQQKAIICRWLYANASILLFDEPTRGVDVGAKQEIYELMEKLAETGNAVVVVSSELDEILRVSDRVLVMRAGDSPTLLNREELSEERIMQHAVPTGQRP
ncbi:MAG TPA: sugar ABC transporter ATP-binding protein [Chthoniobacterales bacterium]